MEYKELPEDTADTLPNKLSDLMVAGRESLAAVLARPKDYTVDMMFAHAPENGKPTRVDMRGAIAAMILRVSRDCDYTFGWPEDKILRTKPLTGIGITRLKLWIIGMVQQRHLHLALQYHDRYITHIPVRIQDIPAVDMVESEWFLPYYNREPEKFIPAWVKLENELVRLGI